MCRGLGIGEGGDRRAPVPERGGCAGVADHAREDGLARSRGLDGIPDRRRNLFGAGDHRRDEQDDQRVDPGVGKEQRQRGRVGDLGGRSEQVDGIRGARLCGQDRRECLSRLVGEIGKCKPGRCAGVGAQDPEPSRVRHHGDAPAARQRLARKQRCRVDELLERSRSDHARLPEQRIRGSVRAGERSRVGARGMRAGSGRSRLERDDRLATGHTPGDPSELARVAERLEVEQDHVRLVVVLPPLQQVVRRDVRLVADRDEGRKAKLALRRLLEQREPEGPALRREADRPLRERVGRKGCVQADFGRGDAQAVGADQPGAVRPDEREQRFLTLQALGADFCEAG